MRKGRSMKRKILAAVVALSFGAGPAWAGNRCVGPQDDLAMKTSTMQQALMVAALSCGDASLYNGFVLSHRAELQRADAMLMAFFVRDNGERGEADYHAFKTKAANVSALESAHDSAGYCANAERLFAAALNGTDLATFVSTEWQQTGEVLRARCTADAGGTNAVRSPGFGAPVAQGPEEPRLASGAPN